MAKHKFNNFQKVVLFMLFVIYLSGLSRKYFYDEAGKVLCNICYQYRGKNLFRFTNDSINFYAFTSTITYKGLRIFCTENNKAIDILKNLYAQDQQAINHLLVELSVVIQETDGTVRSHPFKLCTSKEKNTFSFVPLNISSFRVDFVSRSHQNGYRELLNEEIFYYISENNEIAAYAHSEALLAGIINNFPEIIYNFLEQIHINKVLAINFIYYSSLDTCDCCQELLHQINQSLQDMIKKNYGIYNVPIKYIFYSIAPCKKSSYFVYDEHEPYRIYFNKTHKKFLREDETPIHVKQYYTNTLDISDPFYSSISICTMCIN